jgi:hypothetical protein
MHMTTRFWVARVATVLTLTLASGSASATLTGQYLFEEGSGTMANDTSGLMRHGTLTGATGTPEYVPGIYVGSNNALQFNYNSTTSAYENSQIDRVALPMNTDFIRNAPAMTMMAWVRPDVITGTGGVDGFVGSSRSIVAVGDGLSLTGTRGVLQLLTASGQIRVLGRRVDGGSSASYTTAGATPFAFTAGQTYFVVGILDYVNANIRVYVNGVQHMGGTQTNWTNLGTADPGNLSADTTNLQAHIGTNTGGAGEQWAGLIDGLRIFDHAVSDADILTAYNAEKLLVNDANFDNDNAVNGSDLLLWQRGLGKGPTPAAINGDGDANGDGIVDNADLTVWKSAFGPASVGAASAVPEPAAATLAVILGLAFAAKRRR